MGDQVLVNVVNILRKHLRTDDILGRIGDDEFFICLERIANGICRNDPARASERTEHYHQRGRCNDSGGRTTELPKSTDMRMRQCWMQERRAEILIRSIPICSNNWNATNKR